MTLFGKPYTAVDKPRLTRQQLAQKGRVLYRKLFACSGGDSRRKAREFTLYMLRCWGEHYN
jgi:hypothetical protein